ncbi:MAG TPA: hypothetical protein VKV77_00525 [Methylovirgula sp.]|nr:hypothetical protein [Methylovirgula sp.]
MLKSVAFAAAILGATPAFAGSYVDQYPGYFVPCWHPYPNYTAHIPWGMPMVPSVRTLDYVRGLNAVVPVRVYFIPQQTPYYNVPPYEVIEPF